MKKVGILGGTFDPPHHGHMIMAELVCEKMGLDEVWLLPSHVPPHKQGAAVAASDRKAMVELSVERNAHLKVCDMELKREGTSYTIDTVKNLIKENPLKEFCFIIGGDMVENLPKWHRIDELKQLVQFVGVKRPGYDWNPKVAVQKVEIPLIEISSSMVRDRLASKETIRYLVTDPVYDYIKEHHLYEADAR